MRKFWIVQISSESSDMANKFYIVNHEVVVYTFDLQFGMENE